MSKPSKFKNYSRKISNFFTGKDKLTPQQKEALKYIKSLPDNKFSSDYEDKLALIISYSQLASFNYLKPFSKFLAIGSLSFISASSFIAATILGAIFLPPALSLLIAVLSIVGIIFSICWPFIEVVFYKKSLFNVLDNFEKDNIDPKITKGFNLLKTLPILFDPTPYFNLLKNHPEINKNNLLSGQLKELKYLRKIHLGEDNKTNTSSASDKGIKIKQNQYIDAI